MLPLLSQPTTLLLALQAGEGASATGAGALGAAPPGAWAPLLLLGLPAAVAVVLVWLYVRTARQHRQAQMAPPVWLLPYLERQGDAPGQLPPPAPDADHLALEEVRLESTARLARRKRALLVGLGLNFVAGWAGAAVYLYAANRTVEFEDLPASTALSSTLDTATFQGIEDRNVTAAPPPEATVGPEAPVDTAAVRLRRERQALLVARRRDSIAEATRLDSIALAEEVARRVRDSVASAIRDSLARVAAATPAPPPPPPPAPAPVPAAPDPRVVRERATTVLEGGAGSLVSAINGRDGLAGLLGPGPEQSRFTQFVQEFRPSATLQQVTDVQVTGSAATAVAIVRLAWRGPFGDNRSETGRFRLDATQAGEAWRLTRVVPLQTFP